MKIEVDPEFDNILVNLQESELNELRENLKKEGWRENERILTWHNKIVDGHNRFKLCNELRLEFKSMEMKFENKEDAKLWIINNQLGRRNLSAYDRVRLALEKEEYYKKQAKERQATSGKGIYGGKPLSPNLDEAVESRRAIDDVAKQARVSSATAYKVKKIQEKATTENKKQLREQKISINKAYSDIIHKEKEENNETTRKQFSEKLPSGQFNIIYADPPWKYQFSQANSRSINAHYPPMELNQICELNLPAANDCVLFLWATSPKLVDALKVIKAWGFEYKTSFVWVKDKIGMGYYCRGRHEFLLIATKGTPGIPTTENRFDSVIEYPRKGHSEKPKLVYNLIEKMYPNSQYLELFAINKREGWAGWGLDYDK